MLHLNWHETSHQHNTHYSHIFQNIFLFDLKHFNEYNENFWINFIINDFLNLYQLSYKQTYELSSSLDEDIKNMFVKIKQKYPNKVNKDTIVNYIFSKLNENKLLSVDNTNYIINKLKQLITL